MTVGDQIVEPLEKVLAFFLGQAVDVSDKGADAKERLPAGNRVGPDEGMYG